MRKYLPGLAGNGTAQISLGRPIRQRILERFSARFVFVTFIGLANIEPLYYLGGGSMARKPLSKGGRT